MDFSKRKKKKKKKTVNGSDILSINLFEYLDAIMWPCRHSRSWQTLANYVGKKVPLIILFYDQNQNHCWYCNTNFWVETQWPPLTCAFILFIHTWLDFPSEPVILHKICGWSFNIFISPSYICAQWHRFWLSDHLKKTSPQSLSLRVASKGT